jgi:hypothetical protein
MVLIGMGNSYAFRIEDIVRADPAWDLSLPVFTQCGLPD